NIFNRKHHIATQTTDHSSPVEQQQQQWLPISLNENASRFCQIRSLKTHFNTLQQLFLPVFPFWNDSNECYPLLANIAYDNLSTLEQRIRQAHRHEDKNFNIKLYFDEKSRIDIQNMLMSYSYTWRIHPTVLMFNLNRLFHLIPQFNLKDYITVLEERGKPYELSAEEWFLILEFYLQMDMSCFYMKTSVLSDEGIFSVKLPTAHYGIQQCRDKSCCFCYERLDLTERFEPAMNFSNNQVHCFLNNYQVYLNCDVTCTTSNVIYSLTCPCHQYDYMGRCVEPFRDRMTRIRIMGCRIIRNSLIGSILADHLGEEGDSNPLCIAIRKKFYEHSTKCHVALEIFLKCHPDFWCLIPMTEEQALIDDDKLTATDMELLNQYRNLTATIETETETHSYQRSMTLVRWCVDHVPTPPLNYQFSFRQIIEQYTFFRNRRDRYISPHLDIYNVAIIMALPKDASHPVLHTVQALLTVFTEPKLVVTTTDLCELSDPSWYQHLLHPRLAQYKWKS
ncbi:unnamed protein product, partial [Rotaria magnacalcarata]